MTGLIVAGLRAQTPLETQRLGLRPPTAEERAWMDENMQTTRSVRLNATGLARINAERRDKRLPEITLAGVVPVGAEPRPFLEEGAIVGLGQNGEKVQPAAARFAGLALPATVDNSLGVASPLGGGNVSSDLSAFPPVGSQGNQNSCAAFSSTYYVATHMTGIARGWNNNNNDPTRKFSAKWTYNFANEGADSGTWFSAVFDVLLKLGAAPLSDWPYDGNTLEWPASAFVWRNAIDYRFQEAGRVRNVDTESGLTQAKALLNNNYLLLYATDINAWRFVNFSNDPATTADNPYVGQPVCRVVKDFSRVYDGSDSGHAMTIVGYSDDVWTDINKNGIVDTGEKGAFKIVNSWGPTWGLPGDGLNSYSNVTTTGFAWIAYDALRATSLVPVTSAETYFGTDRAGGTNSYRTAFWGQEIYWITARSSYTPTLLAQFTVSHSRRDQMTLRLGRSATTTTTPAVYWPTRTTAYDGWLNNSATGWPRVFENLGGQASTGGTMVFDCTELLAAGSQRYFLEVADRTAGSAASITDFRLLTSTGAIVAVATNGIPMTADNNASSPARAYVDFVSGAAPTITSASDASATVGQPFSYEIVASDAPTGYTAAGLPHGLILNGTTGVISGTPTQAGSFTVSLGAANATGTGTAALALRVNAALVQLPVITSATTAAGTVGVNFSYSIIATNNPTSFGATNLPAGLALNSGTGVISGIPTLAGSSGVTISATNSGGPTSKGLVLNIAPAPVATPVITSPGSATGASGTNFTYRIEATNNPTSFAASNLPTGMTINSGTGVITGLLSVARTYDITLQATNAGGSGYRALSLLVTGSSSFGPTNDSFSNRIPLSGAATQSNGSNVNATAETGEPAHVGATATKSVWYTWTAAAAGVLTLDTVGSGFDTLLAVYTGSAVTGLTERASDDNGGGGTASRVVLNVTSGTAYQIAVDGRAEAQGSVRLNLAFTASSSGPQNDAFANRTFLSGTGNSSQGNNTGATAELGEPAHAGNTAVKSIWYTWTAPQAGRVSIDTIGSAFDTVLALYTGTAVNGLALVASDDQGGGNNASKITFTAAASTIYQIAVDGWQGAEGGVRLNIAYTSAGPANDNFASRILLSGALVNTNGSNVDASAELNEPAHVADPAAKSVWWTWIAPQTAPVVVDTIASSYDTLLAVYTGTSLVNLTKVGSDDDAGGASSSRVRFNATAGTTYQIAVDGWGGSEGSIKLNVAVGSAAPPVNDAFAGRSLLTGGAASATESTINATTEAGEPAHAGFTAARTVWWSWTAPQTGRVTLTTAGSDFDTVLAAYTGATLGSLVEIASNDQDGELNTSAMTFLVRGGTTYAIAVGGYAGESGSVSLELTFTQSNDLYFTNFDSFSIGSNQLQGTDGWIALPGTSGTSGIFRGFPNTQTAWLGFNTTAASAEFIWRPIGYNPVSAGTPEIQFQVEMGIQDSTNSRRDRFILQLYNIADQLLCSLTFNVATRRITRGDGVSSEDVGGFSLGVRYVLTAEFNFATNRWSAILGSRTLFTDKTMTSTGRALSLGEVVAVWSIATPGSPGNNYLVLDNFRVGLSTTNDLFASATTLSGSSVQATGSNPVATKEPGEPIHAGNSGGHSTWWKWVAPAAGVLELDTRGSTFNTLLGVYTGSSLGALAAVASNDDEPGRTTSAVSLTVVAGTTYWIAVDGYSGATGAITLNLAFAGIVPLPVFLLQPEGQNPAPNNTILLTVAASNAAQYRWQRNGLDVPGAVSPVLILPGAQPALAGVYIARGTSASGVTSSQPAIVGISSTVKALGTAAEVGPNIVHSNGNVYDQLLLNGAAATVKPDANQILRISYIDLQNDIVQVEYFGAGTVTLLLDVPSGPAAPVNYNQGVSYMKGHAGIVVTGANQNSHLSIFSVGRITAINQALFRPDVTYDGLADIAFVAISSTDGKFGGLRTANVSYSNTKGLTGLYAPAVQFTGPVFVGDITAADAAVPFLQIGAGTDCRILGGDLTQLNGRAVQVGGITQLVFGTGSTSHGDILPAKPNRARLEQNGTDVTSQIVVNPP